MRLLFMGTPQFAAVSLEALLEAKLPLVGVVTQPDRPRGRGLQLQPSAVKLSALKHQLPLWQPERLGEPEFLKEFERLAPDLVVVVAFGQKIPDPILLQPALGCINLHASLLPKYRGAAPIQWSLINGDAETGATTFYLNQGWDTGELIYQVTTAVGPDEDYGTLQQRLALLGAKLLVDTVRAIQAGTAPRIKQDDSRASLAPKLRPEQFVIPWTKSARTIHNLVRGLAPVPGAETYLGPERIKVLETRLLPGPSLKEDLPPGQVLEIIKGGGMVVATSDEPLLITKLQPAGKRVMAAAEYANGRHLSPGIVFSSNPTLAAQKSKED